MNDIDDIETLTMNQYIIFCDTCLKSCLVSGNKVNYFLSKCGRMFCDGCSSKECSACKTVCSKKQITNNMSPDVKMFLTESLANLRRAMQGQEYQTQRWKKLIKSMVPYTIKRNKKIKEQYYYYKKLTDEHLIFDVKLQQQMKQNEMTDQHLKELHQSYINVSLQLSQNMCDDNMFPSNDSQNFGNALNDSFFLNNFSPNSLDNPFQDDRLPQGQSKPTNRTKSQFGSHISAHRTQQSSRTFFQPPSRSNRTSANNYGYRSSVPSTIYKPITPKSFKRRL